jgi:hypothetical protein
MKILVILCLMNGGKMPRIDRLIRYRASMYRAMGYDYGVRLNWNTPDRLPFPPGGHPSF